MQCCPHCGGRLHPEIELDPVAQPKVEAQLCPSCGASVSLQQSSCRCGGSMLVDVVADGPVRGAAAVHTIAIALSSMGPPVPPFGNLKRALEEPRPVLVRSCSRDFARRAIALLTQHGVHCSAEPVALQANAVPPSPRSQKIPWTAIVAVALVAAGGAGAYLGVRGRMSEKPTPAASTSSGSVSSFFGSTLNHEPKKVEPVDANATKAIVAKALPSAVAIRCASSVGAGVFVNEDLVVTNAHVICPVDETMSVKLNDGRLLLGKVKKMDERLDLALVQVLGAAATALPIGDAGLLSEGDKITFIGAPIGFDFTVHEAGVSHVGRNLLGVGYIQFDGNVNPGNSGGPLVDSQGKLVGIVSMKVLGAEGLGLAVPVNYLFDGERALAPELAAAAPSDGWKAFLSKVDKADEEERKKVADAFKRPGLIFAKAQRNKGAVAILLIRANGTPHAIDASFKIRLDGKEQCQDVRRVGQWEPLDELRETNAGSSRWVRWLRQNGLSKGLYVGVAQLEARCFRGDPSGGTILLEGADDGAASIALQ